jgi:hypothetical protein
MTAHDSEKDIPLPGFGSGIFFSVRKIGKEN